MEKLIDAKLKNSMVLKFQTGLWFWRTGATLQLGKILGRI
jgi:hypothetical protein